MSPTRNTQGKYVRFDPTITSGNLLTVGGLVVSVVLAYGQLAKNDELQARELETVKVSFRDESLRTEKALDTIQKSLNDQTRVLTSLQVDLASVRGAQSAQAATNTSSTR